jgi:hypothetical protein
MRGSDRQTGSMFSHVSPEALVPLDHPLRPIRDLVNRALARLSSGHFSVDGTRIEARASMKGFRPKDGSAAPPGPGRTGERDVHGATRRNATHASTTDPDARLARKSNGQASKLCYAGHVVRENRHGLAVATTTTLATGTAERDAGETMMAGLDRAKRSTLGAEPQATPEGRYKNDDTRDFVAAMRDLGVTPHSPSEATKPPPQPSSSTPWRRMSAAC